MKNKKSRMTTLFLGLIAFLNSILFFVNLHITTSNVVSDQEVFKSDLESQSDKDSLENAAPVIDGEIPGYTFIITEHPTENEYIHVFKKND